MLHGAGAGIRMHRIRRLVELGRLPGVAVRVVHDGEPVYEQLLGRRCVESRDPLRAEDRFPVASLTKPVVAVAVLQLAERRALALDDPVSRYLPEFSGERVLTAFDPASGAIASRPARRPMTVRHLLTHTSGIHDGFVTSDPVMGRIYEDGGVVFDPSLLLAEKMSRLARLPLAHDPGERWTYGLSADVAGRLVEAVAGMPLDAYLESAVFAPLGMVGSTLVRPGQAVGVVETHLDDGARARPAWRSPGGAGGDRYLSGGGGLYTTLDDYARFALALLRSGTPILAPASVGEMTRDQVGYRVAFGLRFGLGIGVVAAGDVDAPLPPGFGWYGIYGTWWWAMPERRLLVLMFGNALSDGMNLVGFGELVREAVAAYRTE